MTGADRSDLQANPQPRRFLELAELHLRDQALARENRPRNASAALHILTEPMYAVAYALDSVRLVARFGEQLGDRERLESPNVKLPCCT